MKINFETNSILDIAIKMGERKLRELGFKPMDLLHIYNEAKNNCDYCEKLESAINKTIDLLGDHS